jgi:hypothetical protein
MSKKSVLLIGLLSVSLVSGCAQQKQQTQAQMNLLQECLAQQKSQEQTSNERQAEVLIQLQQLQQRVEEQSLLLEAKSDAPTAVKNTEATVANMDCPELEKNVDAQSQSDKQIVGLHEQALILGLDMVMQARISTNVAYSVIDARNIQMFERDGEEWVRFTLYHPETKEPHVLERKRLRFHSLTASNNATSSASTVAPTDKRPVVKMRFTIGKLTQKGEFVLSDRSQSESPMLIGRNILRDVMLVDVSGNNLAPLQKTKNK